MSQHVYKRRYTPERPAPTALDKAKYLLIGYGIGITAAYIVREVVWALR